MNLFRTSRCVFCLFLSILFLPGCTNNLVNKWDDYTGNTDVYYTTGTSTEIMTESVPAIPEDKESWLEFSIPIYWKTELEQAVTKTEKTISNTEGNYTSFLWYNDAHWSYSAQRSVSLLKYLQNYTGIDYVNFGGDIVSDNPDVEYAEIVNALNQWRNETLEFSNHHSVVGNHDDDISMLENRNDLYSFLLEKEANKNSNDSNKFCYYVDNALQRTRYIYWDTGFETNNSNDLEFLIDTLNSTEADWHIVLVSHIWFVYNDTSTPTEGRIPRYAEDIFSIIDAYNARLPGLYVSDSTLHYDFSNAKAKVEFCIGGHTHVDFDFSTDGGIPVVLTETDSYHLRGDDKDINNVNEASVSVIIADYDNHAIHIIRAGRGEDRTIIIS